MRAAIVFLIGGATAFPSYRLAVPNGDNAECDAGLEGCLMGEDEDCLCHGLGHKTCKGGSLPLNKFGKAFAAEGSKWTLDLCLDDSDGDGFTNGEELGDPCCTWSANGISSEYTRNFKVSHPGVAESTLGKSYEPPSCESDDMDMELESVVLDKFNKGERQLEMDLYIDGYEIPKDKTTYAWFAFNFDDDSAEEFHAVFAEAIVKTPAHLHHYLIRGCNTKFPGEKQGQFLGVGLTVMGTAGCDYDFGGWAPGRSIVSTPPWAGVPIGKNANVVAFAVQVHYDNQNQVSGAISRDGFKIYYTPDLRKDTLSSLHLLKTSFASDIVIPAGRERYFLTRTCNLEVTNKTTGEPAEANVYAISYHAHLTGREMYSRFFQGGIDKGKGEDMGSSPIWHFDDQGATILLQRGIKLKTGDTIQGTCIYNSTSFDQDIVIGTETTDEMCWQNVRTWPGDVKLVCAKDDPLWLGELQRGESVVAIHEEHPYTESVAIWQDESKSGCTTTVFGCKKKEIIPGQDYKPPIKTEPMSKAGSFCEVEMIEDDSSTGQMKQAVATVAMCVLLMASTMF